jgi:hypothetical protein
MVFLSRSLRARLLARQHAAGLISPGRVNCRTPLLNVADYSLLVNHKRGSARHEVDFVQNPIGSRYLALEVAQQRERQSFFLGEVGVGSKAINAYAYDLCICGFEFGDISLIRLQFPGSTRGEGQDIKGQDDVLLSTKIAQLDELARLIAQREIWGRVPDLQAHWGLLSGDRRDQSDQEN